MAPPSASAFKGNPFKTRDDFASSARFLLDALAPFTSPGGARVKLGSTGTHYDEVAAQLEGFTRPLWALVPLIKGGLAGELVGEGVERWVRGLVSGTDPASEEFWGASLDIDQRMVEMCVIGFAVAYCPETFYHPLKGDEKKNLTAWLGSLNSREMPRTNWRWFRVSANMALRVVGAPEFSQSQLDDDLEFMESFCLERGWSADGPKKALSTIQPSEERGQTSTTVFGKEEAVTLAPEGHMQCDYYSTGFALQVVPLVYAKLAEDVDPKRAEVFKQRAQRFACDMIPYFDPDGRAIPYGRSMTYRFALAGFWSAAAFADIELPPSMSWGMVKGLLLRHFRWWSEQPIFNDGGVLSIGYAYSNNQFLTEDYNSPGSPYWGCLSYLPLALPASHPFWTSNEEALPLSSLPTQVALPHIGHTLVRATSSSSPELHHTFLLSAGQSPHYPMRAGSSKYAKDAYSSAFGYSVPTGIWGLQQLGADSTLAVCLDPIADLWTVKRQSFDVEAAHESGRMKSSWRVTNGVKCTTFVYPPAALQQGKDDDKQRHKFWHLKVHKIEITSPDSLGVGSSRGFEGTLQLNDAAYAIHANEAEGDQRLLRLLPATTSLSPDSLAPECRYQSEGVALASSKAGVVGILDLTHQLGLNDAVKRKGECVRGDAGSNIVSPRSLFPSLKSEATLGEAAGSKAVWLATVVFAVPTQAYAKKAYEVKQWWDEWADQPSVPQDLLDLVKRA